MRYLTKNTLSSVLLICMPFLVVGQSFDIQLELEVAAGNCGLASDCEENRICFDLYGTPSIDGVILKSYELWFEIETKRTPRLPSFVHYLSDKSCNLLDNLDLPPTGATTRIRVAADDAAPERDNRLNGRTLIHNFCISYSGSDLISGLILTAGDSISHFRSYMSVDLNGVAIDADVKEGVIVVDGKNSPCNLSSAESLPVVSTSMVQEVSDQTVSPHGDSQETAPSLIRAIAQEAHSSDVVYSIVPNPASEKLRLSWTTTLLPDFVRFTDERGKTVFEKKLDREQKGLVVRIAELPVGLYSCQFFHEGSICHQNRFAKID